MSTPESMIVYPIHGNSLHGICNIVQILLPFEADINFYADVKRINGINKAVLIIF